MEIESLVVEGHLVSGLGEGTYMTKLEWVELQCQKKFGFHPQPGTFNIQLDKKESERYSIVKKYRGIKILPPSDIFAAAKCFPVQVGKVKGIVAIPLLDDYPPNILEIIAPIRMRDALGVREGDLIQVKIELGSFVTRGDDQSELK